jgi:hypothetical protein
MRLRRDEEAPVMIMSPMRTTEYPDRATDCQLALEVELQMLVDKGTAAGWDRTEVPAAVANLSINSIAEDLQNLKADHCIAKALGRVEH